MASEEQKAAARDLLTRIRAAFASHDWDTTALLYRQVPKAKGDRAFRLEATCLATRALVAAKQRSAARALLKSLEEKDYKKSVHYEFLARAYLDLKQYKNAAVACERAGGLRLTEVQES